MFTQSTPVDLTHPVYTFIRQQIAQNRIPELSGGVSPFTYSDIQRALSTLSKVNSLSIQEKRRLDLFNIEFDTSQIREGLTAFWNKETRKNFSKQIFSFDTSPHHLLTYQDDQLVSWVEFQETMRWWNHNKSTTGFHSDRMAVHGEFSNHLSFYSDYTLFRLKYKNALADVQMPSEFKQGHRNIFDEISMIFWDLSQASLVYNNPIIDIEFSKKQIYWGFSPRNSPIFSNQVLPFTYIGFSKRYKRISVTSIHGALMPIFPTRRDTLIHDKRLAAHRFNWFVNENILLSFSEIVIYARRHVEPGYILPLNFFWSEEHTLGDRDNVLMAFEGKWKPKPGYEVYGTLFWDELSFFNLFSKWWANKFIFQSGFYWVPQSKFNLPDLRIEFTVARPWVYSHNDSLITYTSANIGLGLPCGPNSQLLFLESNWWLSPQSLWTVSFSHLKKGTGLGSNPTDNYNHRDSSLDYNTPFLMGEIITSNIVEIRGNYRFSIMVEGFIQIVYNDQSDQSYGRIGMILNL